MASVVEFTSYDDIRAALGVSKDEIEDPTIALPLYENNLQSDFEDVSLTLLDDYAALAAASPSGWTAAEQRFVRYVNLFATYSVAVHLTDSLPLFSPKEISDGKALQTRFALDPYKATIVSVKERFERYRSRLVEAYEEIQAGTAVAPTLRTFFGVASPTSDPVTGT